MSNFELEWPAVSSEFLLATLAYTSEKILSKNNLLEIYFKCIQFRF